MITLIATAVAAVTSVAGQAAAGAATARPAPMINPAAPARLQSPAATVLFTPEQGLGSVYCTTTADCWAVGTVMHNGALLNEALHWTGKRWFKVAVPDPGGTAKKDVSGLSGVRCASADNCWAVGLYLKKDADLGQILHWTGKKWSLTTSPTPGGTLSGDVTVFTDVACTSAASCWIAGAYGRADGSMDSILNLALHWNGKAWSQVATPDPAGTGKNRLSSLVSVRCASPANCWAAGFAGILDPEIIIRNEMLHWNGKKWTSHSVPNPAGTTAGDVNELEGLSCTSASNCWAAGTAGKFVSTVLNDALHWNGKKWSKVTTPNPDGTGANSRNTLFGINCTTAKDCWAVGEIGGADSSVATENEVLHWNGTRWAKVTVPQPGGTAGGSISDLIGVRCTARDNCWSVGIQQKKNGPSLNQILHWNGVKWTGI